jgi:hypothetical protein
VEDPSHTAAANTLSCVVCKKPPSTYKLEHSQGFTLILDVLHDGRDPSSGNFTNKRSFSHRHDRAETCWNGTLNPSNLQSLLSSRMPPPVSISFPSSTNFASALFNSFPHSQKRQFGSGTWSWRASASKTRRGVVVTVHFQGKGFVR